MNENAQKWVEALRSGEFAQAQRYLRTDWGYCCLGVACELHRREYGGEWQEAPTTGSGATYGFSYAEEVFLLPAVVQDWLGLTEGEGAFVGGGDDHYSLTSLNDLGASFETIADIIEGEPEGLFDDQANREDED